MCSTNHPPTRTSRAAAGLDRGLFPGCAAHCARGPGGERSFTLPCPALPCLPLMFALSGCPARATVNKTTCPPPGGGGGGGGSRGTPAERSSDSRQNQAGRSHVGGSAGRGRGVLKGVGVSWGVRGGGRLSATDRSDADLRRGQRRPRPGQLPPSPSPAAQAACSCAPPPHRPFVPERPACSFTLLVSGGVGGRAPTPAATWLAWAAWPSQLQVASPPPPSVHVVAGRLADGPQDVGRRQRVGVHCFQCAAGGRVAPSTSSH